MTVIVPGMFVGASDGSSSRPRSVVRRLTISIKRATFRKKTFAGPVSCLL